VAHPDQVKFDNQASAGLWGGAFILLLLFGWPVALAFFIIKLLLGSFISATTWGNSYRN
jgi:hypothetical protein